MEMNPMDDNEVIEVTYRWNAHESLCVNKWIARPFYKEQRNALLKLAAFLILCPVILISLIVIVVILIKSPGDLLTPGFWMDLVRGWMDSAPNLGRLIGLGLLLSAGFWINHRYLSLWLERIRIRHYFSHHPEAEITIHVSINSKELIWEFGETTQTTNPWEAYNQVDQSPDGFLFHLRGQHTWIPRHAFGSEREIEVLGRMAQHNASCYKVVD